MNHIVIDGAAWPADIHAVTGAVRNRAVFQRRVCALKLDAPRRRHIPAIADPAQLIDVAGGDVIEDCVTGMNVRVDRRGEDIDAVNRRVGDSRQIKSPEPVLHFNIVVARIVALRVPHEKVLARVDVIFARGIERLIFAVKIERVAAHGSFPRAQSRQPADLNPSRPGVRHVGAIAHPRIARRNMNQRAGPIACGLVETCIVNDSIRVRLNSGLYRMRWIERGVGPARIVHRQPIDEDLIVSFTQTRGQRRLIDRSACAGPSADRVRAADDDILSAV